MGVILVKRVCQPQCRSNFQQHQWFCDGCHGRNHAALGARNFAAGRLARWARKDPSESACANHFSQHGCRLPRAADRSRSCSSPICGRHPGSEPPDLHECCTTFSGVLNIGHYHRNIPLYTMPLLGIAGCFCMESRSVCGQPVEERDLFWRLNAVNYGDLTEKRDIPREKRDLSALPDSSDTATSLHPIRI